VDEDDSQFEDQEIGESDSYQGIEGDSVVEKPHIEGFFAYEQEIQDIDRTMRGFSPRNGVWVYTSKPLARDEFISSMVNSLRSIVKKGSSLGDLDVDEVNTILMEKNYEFAGSVYLEPTIDDDNAEKIINMHDHMLELYLKTLRDGLGNDTVRQVSANMYQDNKQNKKESIVNWDALGIKKG
jgi:hypothetical protein